MTTRNLLLAVIGTAFCLFLCFQVWTAAQWKNTLQDQGTEGFYDSPNPVNHAKSVSGSSWKDGVQNMIDGCVRAIKSVGHRFRHQPRLAPPDVYFTLTYLPVRTEYGITGVDAGTQVICVKDQGPLLFVKAGNLEFETKRQYLTNDLDVADLAVKNDAEAQQTVASYIAQQQQAIDQRDDKRKMRPSGLH